MEGDTELEWLDEDSLVELPEDATALDAPVWEELTPASDLIVPYDIGEPVAYVSFEEIKRRLGEL
jgi:hypothetical protein